ncbi:MAG: hypothetical protein ACTHNH_20970 [Mesorhizobium sp.]
MPTVYHHTSTLRTNLIWMSGVIQVEGKSEGVFHPRIGEIKTDALSRRLMKDFPPVAWFTKRIEIPGVLTRGATLHTVDKVTGERREIEVTPDSVNVMSLNRLALGFPVSEIPVVPWAEHRGYSTDEGQELNATAREAGDDPNDWYVSETPVDVLKVSEFWYSPSILNPKLKRFDAYLADIRRMVSLCRETKGVFIPPTWMNPDDARLLASQLGTPIASWVAARKFSEHSSP